MGQQKCIEIIIRGDLLLRNVISKLGEQLASSDMDADFSATLVVPPFRMALKLQHPSLAVLHALVNAKDVYRFESMFREILERENCQIITFDQLEKR
ncbi:MAG: hypothetical protein ACFFCO_08630 [Promethearchaeota archaeon]